MPHRHRHAVAGPARGADDRARPLAGVVGAGASARADAGADVDYVEADTYSAPRPLDGRTFDLVYTGIGALCWLPDIDRWAGVVDDLLEPGGRLFVREGHPMMWAVDETRTDGLTLGYAYFETPEPFDFEEAGTYVENDHEFVNTRQLSWNHGIGEILTALLSRGFEVTGFAEHRSVPWEALPGRMVRDGDLDEWRLVDEAERLPLSYTLQARKPAPLGPRAAEPGEEALVVDHHPLDGAAADDGPHGIRRLDLEAQAAALDRRHQRDDGDLLPHPAGREVLQPHRRPDARRARRQPPSTARQVAASHQASSRGVPSTGSPPEASATAVSSSVTTARMTPRSPTLAPMATTVGTAVTVAERARGRSRYRERPTERT